MARPLILGAGPAGCAAAVELARSGVSPTLLDRCATVGDPLCGGFMSWRTLSQLEALGIDLSDLGGQPVDRLRLFGRGTWVETPLPRPSLGLSRHALDTRMRETATTAGAQFAIDTIRGISASTAHGQRQDWHGESLFLATGKHDVRGHSRPRQSEDPALGLRLRLPPGNARRRLIGSAIELHLFRGGYAGIVLQEGGSANICLALRKSALASAGGDPLTLLSRVAEDNAGFADRLGPDFSRARVESIGAVPYGWIAHETKPGLFRLGDQAAVIPSLAGEGMSIAVASGTMAARHWLQGGTGAAQAYQRAFAARAYRPVQMAKAARVLAETRLGAAAALALARLLPGLVIDLAERCRIGRDSIQSDRATCTHARPC
ncbi:NAD(P)/FAD-dependent oxidoreductase [Aurantiacibacter poecillastricola]|uniref:NAD(P)/FAD-dependent oxidoreductase n=1 Tax=Aurantiacibacter poecillastricola TaxID=3064385 RepID=UPI00273FCA45|nr:FAD-dependent monooxygenase [Aurantiacibacter sp. 219JJ12-13]MDP5261711.1 FAD-dependent monooxygenase [Aurantiacibacter sp. 219JJ12-13]